MHEHALTKLSPAGGCAAKIEPAVLQQIIDGLEIDATDKSINIHYRDDVGIMSFPPEAQHLVQSVDMISPVSDDPRIFGKIAAAHALSDLYAKGAYPLSGLLMLEMPALLVSPKVASEILQGAIDTLHDAGARFLGGHTIASQELHLGLAVTGYLKQAVIPDTTCEKDDLLVLTKPIGTGIVITASKSQNAGYPIKDFSSEIVRFTEQQMLSLNEHASEVLRQVGVNACTDVTGFGLLGHLLEMLSPSGLSARIYLKQVPFIPGVVKLAEQEIISAGGERNAAFYWKNCHFASHINYAQRMVLFDPQTSGGLLISVPRKNEDLLLDGLKEKGIEASIIGQVTQEDPRTIQVVD